MPKCCKILLSFFWFGLPLLIISQENQFKDTIIDGKSAQVHKETGAIKFLALKQASNKANDSLVKKEQDIVSNFHTVAANETFIDIAYKYDISALELKKLNKLKDYTIKEGQVLRVIDSNTNGSDSPVKIKVSATESNEANTSKTNVNANDNDIWIVKKGETLYHIATTNNLTVKALMQINGLSATTIKVGQELRLKK